MTEQAARSSLEIRFNPSDLGLLFGPVDMRTAKASGSADRPVVIAEVPSGLLKGVAA